MEIFFLFASLADYLWSPVEFANICDLQKRPGQFFMGVLENPGFCLSVWELWTADDPSSYQGKPTIFLVVLCAERLANVVSYLHNFQYNITSSQTAADYMATGDSLWQLTSALSNDTIANLWLIILWSTIMLQMTNRCTTRTTISKVGKTLAVGHNNDKDGADMWWQTRTEFSCCINYVIRIRIQGLWVYGLSHSSLVLNNFIKIIVTSAQSHLLQDSVVCSASNHTYIKIIIIISSNSVRWYRTCGCTWAVRRGSGWLYIPIWTMSLNDRPTASSTLSSSSMPDAVDLGDMTEDRLATSGDWAVI